MSEIEWPPNMKIPGPTMTVHFLIWLLTLTWPKLKERFWLNIQKTLKATYHANKLQENQYALHATVMMKKIQKLRQAGKNLNFLKEKNNIKLPIVWPAEKRLSRDYKTLRVARFNEHPK